MPHWLNRLKINKGSSNKNLSACCFRSRIDDDIDKTKQAEDLSSSDVICLLEKHLINFESYQEYGTLQDKQVPQEEILTQNTLQDIDDMGSIENIFRLSIKDLTNNELLEKVNDSTRSVNSISMSSPSIEVNEPVPVKSPINR